MGFVVGVVKAIGFAVKETFRQPGVKSAIQPKAQILTPQELATLRQYVPWEQLKLSPEQLRRMATHLPDDPHVTRKMVEDMIRVSRTPELAAILRYLKSHAASGLSRVDRAVLIQAAMEKVNLLHTMSHLF